MSIIQTLWIGKELSVMEILSINSFLKNGHSFHLYVYDEIDNIPEGVVIHDANKIINRNRVFKYKDHDSYAGFSNLFRYKLLLEKGGFWVDTDVVNLRKFDFEQEYIFAGFREKRRFLRWHINACNCIIKAPKNSEIMEYCYEKSLTSNDEELTWGQTGPVLLTKAVKKFDLNQFVSEPNIFCPINWNESDKLIDGKQYDRYTKKSYAIHLWNEMWRREKIDKSGAFPENSIYEFLKRKYL